MTPLISSMFLDVSANCLISVVLGYVMHKFYSCWELPIEKIINLASIKKIAVNVRTFCRCPFRRRCRQQKISTQPLIILKAFGGRAKKKKKKKAPADVACDAGGSFFSAGEHIPRLSTHTLSEYISVATAPTLIYR